MTRRKTRRSISTTSIYRWLPRQSLRWRNLCIDRLRISLSEAACVFAGAHVISPQLTDSTAVWQVRIEIQNWNLEMKFQPSIENQNLLLDKDPHSSCGAVNCSVPNLGLLSVPDRPLWDRCEAVHHAGPAWKLSKSPASVLAKFLFLAGTSKVNDAPTLQTWRYNQ